jgi:hypothetical protein
MDNDENGMNGANGDYGNEDYDGGNMDGDDNNNNNNGGANNNNGDGDVDQYFDDAGDVGYLPADHVTTNYF